MAVAGKRCECSPIEQSMVTVRRCDDVEGRWENEKRGRRGKRAREEARQNQEKRVAGLMGRA